ncbi:unnamed protein product [Miscanthus lutarioriparius]|uniref:Uncharacterized protein n=1 Tax=Miscanthus lutarioriparius TaxID=422564 RepID=A0A811SS02_9POAL|nr:unnamed protein product [Miscanthus lutarioriparius]
METLPGYLKDVNPRDLHVECDISLLASIAEGESGPEWDKFSHIKQVKAYADDDDNNIERKWYVKYTRDPFSFKTNISPSARRFRGGVIGQSGASLKEFIVEQQRSNNKVECRMDKKQPWRLELSSLRPKKKQWSLITTLRVVVRQSDAGHCK